MTQQTLQPISVKQVSFKTAWNHHYEKVSQKTGKNLIRVYGSPVNWLENIPTRGRASCALRISIALTWAGIAFPRIHYIWEHKKRGEIYPVRASDYVDILATGEDLTGTPIEKIKVIKNRKGIVYFGGFDNYSGHLTLWDGKKLHFSNENSYWTMQTVIFWVMSD